MLSLGTYPDTTLAIARRKADAVRHLMAEGFDPSQKREVERETLAKVREADAREAHELPPLDSFEAVAREWYAIKRDQWAASYGAKIMARFEADVFPWIGKQPIANITPIGQPLATSHDAQPPGVSLARTNALARASSSGRTS
jgi:Arm DNA-binding domain